MAGHGYLADKSAARTAADTDFDFRKTFGLIREHPEVLRDLGLVFELLVDGAELATGDPAERYLSIRTTTPLAITITSPWTKYYIDSTGVWPAPNTSQTAPIRRGIIDLTNVSRVDVGDEPTTPPPWAIATFDVDGGVTGLRTARKLLDQGQRDRDIKLPTLRSSGLALIRPGRQDDFSNRMNAAVYPQPRRG